MKPELTSLLACPRDGGHPLLARPDKARDDGKEIISGRVSCPLCGRAYKIIEGIPDLCEFPEKAEIDGLKKREIMIRDEQAAGYNEHFTPYRNAVERAAVLHHLDLQPHHRVLELGCGTGRFTGWLSDRCSEWVAVDYSMRSLQQLVTTVGSRESLHVLRADVNRLPLAADRCFDRILSTQMLEHLPSHELRRQLLERCAELLTEDGRLVLTTYNYNQEMRARRIPKQGVHPSGIYYYCYAADELKQELNRCFDVDVLCGVQNLWLVPVQLITAASSLAARADGLLARTRLSRSTGHLLLVTGRPLSR